MNTFPHNKVFIDSNCLSLDQLKLYHEDKLTAKEKHGVENHLLDCELCSNALLGFALIPVTATDVADVNKRIDTLTGAHQPSFIDPKFFIGIAAVVMISVSCFFVYRSFNPNQTIVADNDPMKNKNELFVSGQPPENTIVLDKKNEDVKKLIATLPPDVLPVKVEIVHPNEAFTMEMLEMKSPDLIITDKSNSLDMDNVKVPVLMIGIDTFILDLKITDYDKYYFVNMDKLKQVSHNTDPVFENDKERDNGSGVYKLQEWEVTTTKQVLRSALLKFNSQDYENAIKLFNTLVKHNADDVNALFYGGVSYYNTGNSEKALDYLTRVMTSNNGSFYEEAKWYKALTYLKKRDADGARKLFSEIVANNGFYKEQAKEKLKGL